MKEIRTHLSVAEINDAFRHLAIGLTPRRACLALRIGLQSDSMSNHHPHLSDAELLDRLRRFANTLLRHALNGESFDSDEIIDLAMQVQLAAGVGTEDEPEFEMHPRIQIKFPQADGEMQ